MSKATPRQRSTVGTVRPPLSLARVSALLDQKLRLSEFNDTSHNGLQVENSGRVTRVCCGVDASLEFFEHAARQGADLLICHHGLSWGDSLARITDLNYRRVSFLMKHDMALYACHLPLDAHPRLGNNALICKALGIKRRRPFGTYAGVKIGYAGTLATPMRFSVFMARVRREIGEARSASFGKKTVRSVAVVSGGGGGELAEAGRDGIDVFLTGDPGLPAYNMAREYGINAVFAGHYATEVFGVRALGQLLQKAFGTPADFVDLKIPY